MKNQVIRTSSFVIAAAILLLASCKSNKSTSEQAQSTEAPVEVTAVKLLADYEADPAVADKQYKGKKLIVSGEVLSTTARQDGTSTVLLNSQESSIGSIQCLFPAEQTASTGKLVREQQTKITGICDGMDDIGVSVLIKESAIQ